MTQIGIEVWLATGYAIFLMAVALFLERLALHCHRRSRRFHTSGFTFRSEVDAWECPARQLLTRASIDLERKLVIYRAPARVCNACVLKPECTQSETGREIAKTSGSWVQSQIGRFHRGLSLTLCVLAALLLLVEFFRFHAFAERLLSAAVLLLILGFMKRLTVELSAG